VLVFFAVLLEIGGVLARPMEGESALGSCLRGLRFTLALAALGLWCAGRKKTAAGVLALDGILWVCSGLIPR
jgi:hypothetical protein